jgi:hypothetical protein
MRLPKVKWLVASIIGAGLITHLDGYWFSLVLGSIANALLAKVLKRVFKMPRPDMTEKKDPGMPSSHAHMLGYFAGFALFSDHPQVSLFTYIFALLVSYERVSRKIHSVEQCGVGVVTGTLGALAWLRMGAHDSMLGLDETVFKNKTDVAPLSLAGALILSAVLVFSGLGRKISGRYEKESAESDDD